MDDWKEPLKRYLEDLRLAQEEQEREQAKRIAEASTKPVRKKTTARKKQPAKVRLTKPEKWMVGENIKALAKMRNNILSQAIYKKAGQFTIKIVNEFYGSFHNACVELCILDSDGVDDYNMVVTDIHRVADMHNGKVDEDIYREEGIFSIKAIDQLHGFCGILRKEGYLPPETAYPMYRYKKYPCNTTQKWNQTCFRKIYGI